MNSAAHRLTILRTFRAVWPSLWAQLWAGRLVAVDVCLTAWLAAVLRSGNLSSVLGSRQGKWATFAVACRVCHRWLHGLSSLPFLPAQVLYYQGEFLKCLPRSLRDHQTRLAVRMFQAASRLSMIENAHDLSVATPDGVDLSGMYFRGHNAAGPTTLDGPTVIYFNPNAGAWEDVDGDMVEAYVEAGINVVVFNYRGVSNSRWQKILGSAWLGEAIGRYLTLERDGVERDCDAVLQLVVNGLKVPPSRVLLVGQSIGAGLSLQAASRCHGQVGVCNRRSFSSLASLAGWHAPRLLRLRHASAWFHLVSASIPFLVKVLGWNIDSVGAWNQMRGFKWVEYAENDRIIPDSVSLVRDVETPRVVRFAGLLNEDNHNRILTEEEREKHMALVKSALAIDGQAST